MKMITRVCRRVAAAIALVSAALAGPALAAQGPLVTPAWVEQELQAQRVLVLDASMPQQYAAGHIPGAVSAPVFGITGREVAPAEMERRLRAWGVSAGRRIVVYDEGGSWMAARLFDDLYVHGVPASDIVLLDGGLHAWKAAGKPVTKEPTPPPAPGNVSVTAVRADTRVRLDEFLLATGDPQRHAIVDALEPPYYYGGAKFFDRAGHVPNALLWPSSDFFDPQTKTFRSPDEIRRMLERLGIRPEQTVHVYCGGGGAASVPVFALRFLLGRDKVKLYNLSQREWLQDERQLPLWTHAAPGMLRAAPWVSAWASPMLRMFDLSRVSVLDVRADEAYRRGHVPLAVHLPADVFRAQLREPAQLAARLGAAGVDVRHEVVLAADQGLTPDVALAWWALERLGQHKVSMLTDGLDDWALAGHAVVKEPTTIGTPKSPQELAVPATVYPGDRLRAELAASRASAAPAPGVSRVFVAAGRQPSAAAALPAGARVIHLPHTDLLGANGQPKPAKDLWTLLAKAGVPRHAEVIAVADDAGEAAVNYVVLKLMGWRDVKLWLGD